jgi:hypothetical protein
MMATWSTSKPPGDWDSVLPSSVDIVDWIPVSDLAGGKGFWLLGKDGGVFAVGGAPFLGGYQGQKYANDPNRTFERIQGNGQGGYSLRSTTDEVYGANGEFSPPQPPPKPEAKPLTSDPAVTSTSAAATVKNTLRNVGLDMDQGTLDTLTASFRTGGNDAFMLALRDTPQYKQRYPMMDTLDKAGHHISEDAYRSVEKTYGQTMDAYGIPKQFQKEYIDQFIGGEVSPDEVNSRIKDAATAAYQSPPEVRAALSSMYGLTGGEIISYFIDPKKSTNLIQQKVLAGAQTGAAAEASGYGALTQSEAESIGYDRGVGPGQAATGFGQLYHERELFNPLDSGEQAITREQQLGAQFGGSGADQEAIKRQAARRTAQFQAGGGYATGQGGVSGLGTSNQ